MARQTEETVSEAVRSTLARYKAEAAVDANDLTDVLFALEYSVPEVARALPGLRNQGLDGVVAVNAYMRGERDLEIFGIGTVRRHNERD